MTGSVLLDTNVFTSRLREKSPLAHLYAKIAAVAIRWAVPLVAHDAVFVGCPGLDLRTEPAG